MPTALVSGARLSYELIGQAGPPIALTSGGQSSMEAMRPFADHLSDRYRVLIWDRRNCGAADLYFEPSPDEIQVFANDLHGLMGQLDLLPAYFGGSSGGTLTSLRLALTFPTDVCGLLLLNPPLHDPGEVAEFAQDGWGALADLAETRGMSAVLEAGWIKGLVDDYPQHRERLLSLDRKVFATSLRGWISTWSAPGCYWGMDPTAIQGISAPAIVFSNENRPSHPWSAVDMLCDLMPNAVTPELHPDEASEIKRLVKEKSPERYRQAMVSAWRRFIQRTERR